MFKPASNSKHADHAYIKSDSLGYFSGAECGFFGNYQNGIGTTYESYDNCFEGYRYITLKGFIKDGVSYGELTNLPDDLGIDSEQTELLITPNPSIDFIRLDPSLDQLEIFSLSGERISFLNITNGKVDISELNAGLYIVHAYRGDTLVGISKFSKL